MNKEKIKAKGIVESRQAIALFEEILNLMKEGGAHFEHEGQSVDLTAGDAAEMEIEIKHKDGKQKLEFELEWKEGLHLGGASEDITSGLKVSSKKTEESGDEMGRRNVRAENFSDMPASEGALF